MASKVIRLLHWGEDSLAFLVLFLLALFPTMEVVARKFFHTGVANSTEYTHYLVLVLTFFASIVTSREHKHLSISFDFPFSPGVKEKVAVATSTLAAALTMAMAWAALSFALNGFDASDKVGPFQIRTIALALPLGYAIMALRFVTGLPARAWARGIAALGLALGTLLALEPIFNALTSLGLLELPPEGVIGFFHQLMAWLGWPLLLLLIVAAVFGAPIFIVLGGAGYLLFARLGEPLEVVPNQAFAMLTSSSLPAIPLFAFTGFLLAESRAGERLVRLFRAFFSWVPGGLAIMAILVCAFFTTFTGASGVTIVALGGLLSYVMINSRYDQTFTKGLLTASGSIGLLFAPSLPVIIYGVTAQINIKHMFIAGLLPGFLLVLAMAAMGVVHAGKVSVERAPFQPREAWAAFRSAFGEILLPVVIVAGYFGGLTTLVECSAIAAIYSLLLEVGLHRDLKPRDLSTVMLKCLPVVGGVLTILALANGLSYYIVDAEIPLKLTAWATATIGSKYVFLLLLNVLLLITGCFLDIYSAIMVVVPLIIPVGAAFGIHPIHLGIIFLANLELGYLTPPVGLNLYLSSYTFDEPINKVYRYVAPFLLVQVAVVLLITYVPILSLGLLQFVR